MYSCRCGATAGPTAHFNSGTTVPDTFGRPYDTTSPSSCAACGPSARVWPVGGLVPDPGSAFSALGPGAPWPRFLFEVSVLDFQRTGTGVIA